MLDEPAKYGVKLTIINKMDYAEYREICDAIQKLGYTITLVDNGNTVLQKEGRNGGTEGSARAPE